MLILEWRGAVRIWLVVFCVGAALVALHLTVSMITYHTIVDYPLVWAALSGVFFLSVAVGLLIGIPLANKVRAPELLFILCLLAGILVFVLSLPLSYGTFEINYTIFIVIVLNNSAH